MQMPTVVQTLHTLSSSEMRKEMPRASHMQQVVGVGKGPWVMRFYI